MNNGLPQGSGYPLLFLICTSMTSLKLFLGNFFMPMVSISQSKGSISVMQKTCYLKISKKCMTTSKTVTSNHV